MSLKQVSIDELVSVEEGYACPKCPGETFETMDAWTSHVSDTHEPMREWIARWSNPETSPSASRGGRR